MKLASLALNMKNQDPTQMPTWKVLRMATIEGAEAIGLDHEIGSLEPGKKADLILVDLRKPSMVPVLRDPVRNIVPNLVLSARGDEVAMSIIDGRVVYEGGRITTIEEGELLESIQQVSRDVSSRASDEVGRRKTSQHRLTLEGRY
jgi:5-methylthioadenosine/S-adenosylhomocysteine deaminase